VNCFASPKQKDRPKAVSVFAIVQSVDQARRSDGPPCFRRYVMKPRPMKPRIIMAQVEGSGTAEREGRNVTDKKGTSYAPACFAKEQEAKALNLNSKALEDAMRRLFTKNKIHVVTEGPQSRQRSRLVAM
jgi:hypothetical protein